jgi:hypothetical protein
MQYFNQNRPKAEAFQINTGGVQKVGNVDSLQTKKLATKPDVKKTGGFGMDDGLAIAGGVASLLTSDKPELDMSGNTDYTGVKNTDAGVTSAEDVVSDVVGVGTDLASGNLLGAGMKTLKALKGISGDGEQKRKLALAKERFQNKKRYQSEKAIDKISDSQKMNDIVGEDNIEYVDNLKNSPGYNRFKRNSQYTI